MDPLTHVATGVVCSQLLTSPSRWWAALAGALFAVLPDLDYFYIFWDRLAFIRYHRGFTHSLVALPLLALAGSAGRPGPGRPPLVQTPVHSGAHGAGVPPAPGPGHLLWHADLKPLFPAPLYPGLGFYHRPLSYRPAGGRSHKRPGFPPLGPPFGSLVPGRSHGLYAGVRLLPSPGPGPGPPGMASDRPPQPPEQTVAALPQPFSCRRWQLIAARPGEIRQAFVQLPFAAVLGEDRGGRRQRRLRSPRARTVWRRPWPIKPPAISPSRSGPRLRRPPPTLRKPKNFGQLSGVARFPLLCRAGSQEGEQLLEWLDLRFSIPGRSFPFVLQLRLDAQGRLALAHRPRPGQKVLSWWGGRAWAPMSQVGERGRHALPGPPHLEHF